MSALASLAVPARRWRDSWDMAAREVAEEAAVAVVVNGSTLAVMMATPADLVEFGIGFALSEGIVSGIGEIERTDVVAHELGHEVRLWVPAARAAMLARRRRQMAGPTGCGLCGIESLEEARQALPVVRAEVRVSAAEVQAAMADMHTRQVLNGVTRAVHAAGFWRQDTGLVAVREDVGRHNALDKLAGALAQDGVDGASGVVLLTSRVSIEMIQKAVRIGAGIVVAVSAPTSLAISIAERAGLTLVAVARSDGFEVFTHPYRIA